MSVGGFGASGLGCKVLGATFRVDLRVVFLAAAFFAVDFRPFGIAAPFKE